MRANNKIKLSLDSLPKQWDDFISSSEVAVASKQQGFWQDLVSAYVSSTRFDSEELCKDYFRQFWENRSLLSADNKKAMITAATHGYDVFIEQRLSGLDVNEKSVIIGYKAALKETALHKAAYYNHPEVVRVLLSHGADINAKRTDGEMPIHVAAMIGSVAVIEVLVNYDKRQLNVAGREGRPPLFNATMNERLDVINALCALGADIGLVNSHSGYTALHLAAIKNKDKAADALIKNGADVNLLDGYKITALQRCALQRLPSLAVAKILIAHQADANLGDSSPLFLLASKAIQRSPDTVEFAKLLVEAGADVNACSKGDTALDVLLYLKDSGKLAKEDLKLFDYLNEHPLSKPSQQHSDSKKL